MDNHTYLLVFLVDWGGSMTREAIRVNQDRFPSLSKEYLCWNENDVQEELQCFFENPSDVVRIEQIDYISMNPVNCEE